MISHNPQTPPNMENEKLKELMKQVKSSENSEERANALTELKRMGQELSPEQLKSLVDCNCGPAGEHPVEPWP